MLMNVSASDNSNDDEDETIVNISVLTSDLFPINISKWSTLSVLQIVDAFVSLL